MGKAEERTILLVDDDEYLTKMLTFLFIANGFKLEASKNGLDALDALKRITPEAIILDILMPVMDGFEFLKLIKEDTALKAIPVIVLSALPSSHNRERVLSLGADDYIVKPFISSELINKTIEVIEAGGSRKLD